MTSETDAMKRIEIVPATGERWADLEALFGARGACQGCWCMWWRMARAEFNRAGEEGRKAALRGLLEGQQDVNPALQEQLAPGLLAYDGGKAVGWISVGPRAQYLALENSRSLRRLDDQPVWSVVCFFVNKTHRRKGLMKALLKAAVDYARAHRAKIVEGYPLDMDSPKLAGQKLSGSSGFMGMVSAFKIAGFIEAKRASNTQVVMRYTI